VVLPTYNRARLKQDFDTLEGATIACFGHPFIVCSQQGAESRTSGDWIDSAHGVRPGRLAVVGNTSTICPGGAKAAPCKSGL